MKYVLRNQDGAIYEPSFCIGYSLKRALDDTLSGELDYLLYRLTISRKWYWPFWKKRRTREIWVADSRELFVVIDELEATYRLHGERLAEQHVRRPGRGN